MDSAEKLLERLGFPYASHQKQVSCAHELACQRPCALQARELHLCRLGLSLGVRGAVFSWGASLPAGPTCCCWTRFVQAASVGHVGSM